MPDLIRLDTPRNLDAATVRQIESVLNDDALANMLADGIRHGREDTLEILDPSTPRFQCGQLAYLLICNHLRKILNRAAWKEDLTDNQQSFVRAGDENSKPVRLTYFAGRITEDEASFKLNPKGRQTRINMASNAAQMSLPFPEWEEPINTEAPSPDDLTFFVMSCWDWEEVDGTPIIRIRAWLAFCTAALDRRGKPQAEDDESRFSRTTYLAKRPLIDYRYSGLLPISNDLKPATAKPVIIDLSDITDESSGN